MRNGVVLGSNGTLGRAVIEMLLNNRHFKQVTALLDKDTRKLKSFHVTKAIGNFNEPESFAEFLTGADDLFVCMSSRLSKENVEPMEALDYSIPLNLITFAKKSGVKNIHLVVPPGALEQTTDEYLSARAKLIQETKMLNFDSVNIYLANGVVKATQKDHIIYAILGSILNLITMGYWHKNRPLNVYTLAKVMVQMAVKPNNGFNVFTSHQIIALA